MKIHEYQAKEILNQHGVSVPEGGIASTPDEAAAIARKLGGKVVVKAQVHAGGRGKAGGIKVVASPEEARDAANAMLGTKLTTFQTGPDGVPVRRVLIERVIEATSELYLAIVIDGATEGAVVIASESGGMEIETVAEATPENILRVEIDSALGLQPYQGRKLAYGLNLSAELIRPVSMLIDGMYQAFMSNHCSLLEVNPLVITKDAAVLAVDAKITIDDDALFKHPEAKELHDPEQEDPQEVRAQQRNISYVKLDGDVGCIVNGAGLAMATMDVVMAAGAAPANFLDIGGGADEEKVSEALKIVYSDPAVSRVLINVFGGILRCDVAARGFIKASEEMGDSVRPMVVRMLGTNAEEGRKLLTESKLDVTMVNDLNEAAEAIKSSH